MHVADVDVVLPEHRADEADHARLIGIAYDQHVIGGGHIDRMFVDRHDTVIASHTHECAAERMAPSAHRDAVHEIFRYGIVGRLDGDAAVACHVGGGDVGHRVV